MVRRALGLDEVALVGQDWGGVLAFDRAARHPGRVRGVAFMKTILRPMSWEEYPPAARARFEAIRTPGVREGMLLDRNLFIEDSEVPKLLLTFDGSPALMVGAEQAARGREEHCGAGDRVLRSGRPPLPRGPPRGNRRRRQRLGGPALPRGLSGGRARAAPEACASSPRPDMY
ncbi:alpha/beta fold hydrolase [Streptomyces sp. NPDC048269]|uniref:alpha/beta fold hydrolase n=1 Tax=Streptomyces sp. NPDC048269 TaxID=3155753 RepID=UPI0034147ED6